MMTTLKFSKTFRSMSLAKCMLSDSSVKELLVWMSQKPLIKHLNIERNSRWTLNCRHTMLVISLLKKTDS
jgi:hypothetical protein